MHKIKRRTKKNIIGLTFSGKLGREEYEELVPILEDKIREFGKIRLLIELDHWEGWGPQAAFKDFLFVIKNSFRIERIAFILSSKSDKQVILIDHPFTPLFGHNTRYFSDKEKDAAWEWVEEGIIPSLRQEDASFEKTQGSALAKKVRYGTDMKVLIVGGGVSGLTAAALMDKRGFKVTLVEASGDTLKKHRVFNMWSGAAGAIKSLGLYDKLLRRSEAQSEGSLFDSEGKLLSSFNNDEVGGEFAPALSVSYNKLRSVLVKGIDPDSLKLRIAATKITQTEQEVTVDFTDGSSSSFDCVICSDGVHSKTREALLGGVKADYSGMIGWSFSINPEFQYKKGISVYKSENAYFKLFPIKERLYVFAAVKHPKDLKLEPPYALDTLKDSFKEYKGIVPKILSQIDTSTLFFHGPLYTCLAKELVLGRVALLGDAAHALLPGAVLGSSLNFDSAVALVDKLSRSDSQLVSYSLKAYEKKRLTDIKNLEALLNKNNLDPLSFSGDYSRKKSDQSNYSAFWKEFLSDSI